MKEKRQFNNNKKRKFSKSKSTARSTARFKISSDTNIDYKNLPLIQRFLNDRGKIVPKRISGVSSKEQRLLSKAIKQARILALLPSGGVNK